MNTPLSNLNVISMPVSVLDVLMSKFQEEIRDLKIVYDEKASFETALKKFRSDNDLTETRGPCFPLLGWKRSVMRFNEDGAGRRAARFQAQRRIPGDPSTRALKFALVHGAFDFEFNYYATSILDIERFEIAYLSDEGISKIKEVQIQLPLDIYNQPFKYYIHWEPFQEKVFEYEEMFYKQVVGLSKIIGWFFVVQGLQGVIKSICTNIKDNSLSHPGVLLAEIAIDAT